MDDRLIIRYLGLRRPIYRQTATYGHFGRDYLALRWEHLDRVQQLQELTGLRAGQIEPVLEATR